MASETGESDGDGSDCPCSLGQQEAMAKQLGAEYLNKHDTVGNTVEATDDTQC